MNQRSEKATGQSFQDSTLSWSHYLSLCIQGTCIAAEMLIQEGQNQKDSHHSHCDKPSGRRE